MSDVYKPQTFTLTSSSRFASGKTPTTDDHMEVDKALKHASSTSEAIRYLLKQGWNVKAICAKLTTADGRSIPPQFVSNVKNRNLKRS